MGGRWVNGRRKRSELISGRKVDRLVEVQWVLSPMCHIYDSRQVSFLSTCLLTWKMGQTISPHRLVRSFQFGSICKSFYSVWNGTQMFTIVITNANHKALPSLSTPKHGWPYVLDAAASKRIGRLRQGYRNAAVGPGIHIWFQGERLVTELESREPHVPPCSNTQKLQWVEYTSPSHPRPQFC